MKTLLIFLVSFILSCRLFSQCDVKNTTFINGEEIYYDIYYNWGFIWLNAGWVEFKVKDTYYHGKNVYFFDAVGETRENYDWIFKVRDRYQSYVDKETMLPLWFYRINHEGDFYVENKYYFHHDEKLAYSFIENSDRPYLADTLGIKDCTVDLLSMIYHTRNIDLTNVKKNQKFPINCVIDNELYDIYIRYLGKEEMEDRQGQTFNCLKFSALLVEGTIFKGGEDMFIWLTDDNNRIPVMVQAKILVGSVKAYWTGYKNLRYPVEAIKEKAFQK